MIHVDYLLICLCVCASEMKTVNFPKLGQKYFQSQSLCLGKSVQFDLLAIFLLNSYIARAKKQRQKSQMKSHTTFNFSYQVKSIHNFYCLLVCHYHLVALSSCSQHTHIIVQSIIQCNQNDDIFHHIFSHMCKCVCVCVF